jgi:hypothetical protein
MQLEDVPKFFNNGQNIGLLLGEPSGGLIDIDLDTPEAVAAGRYLLPATLCSGRESSPNSHYWYRCEPVPETAKFQVPRGTGAGAEMFVELRSTGKQTVVAPSAHPDGDKYAWGEGETATISGPELVERVREVATAALLARHWPSKGRHDITLAAAGYLGRRLAPERVEAVIEAAAGVAGDEEWRDRSRAARDTLEGLRAGRQVTGGPTLDQLAPGVPEILSRWWGWSREPDSAPVSGSANGDDTKLSDEEETARKEERAKEAWEDCADLAKTPNLTAVFADTLKRSGVAGERKQVQLLYLSLNSRHLDKPVSVAVKGPSSGGKSHLVERVVAGFPESAVYELTSMSEKALIYLDEDMRHRFLVIYEASGMEGDMQTYLIRSLLSENRIRYQTAESTSKGVVPRLLEMEGPTGLMVTTTRNRMHPENETRLLSLYVTDTRVQTKAIFRALAEEDREEVSLEEWKTLQTWIEGGRTVVSVPFGKVLAEMVPPLATRLRRDFGAVLRLIKSHTLLHRAQRETDGKNRLVATLDDYAVVRDLIADLVSEGVGGTVRDTTKETVRAVGSLLSGKDADETVGIKKIADKLQLDRSTAQRRVKTAADEGYLQNDEDKKGKAARWRIGEPMPADVVVLPTREDLEAEYEGVRVCNDVGGETQGCAEEGCADQKVCICTPPPNKNTSHADENENAVDTPNSSNGSNDTSAENASWGRGGKKNAHLHTPTDGVENGSDALHTAHPIAHPDEPTGEQRRRIAEQVRQGTSENAARAQILGDYDGWLGS